MGVAQTGQGMPRGMAGVLPLAVCRSDGELERDIAGTGGGDACRRLRSRLDVDAAPAAVMEGAGGRSRIRMRRPDVDIEAVRDMLQGTPEQHILEIPGVRDERHMSGLQATDQIGCTSAFSCIIRSGSD